jgi:transposase-like protein
MTETISEASPFDDLPEQEQEAKPSRSKRRIPSASDGIQHNGCKNPSCSQYGMPPPETAKRGVVGPYALSGSAKSKGSIVLKCNACGEMPPLKSNKGIAEEVRRLSSYLKPKEWFCPEETCENSFVPVGTPGAYVSHGLTPHGSQRFKCKECGKTFTTEGKPTRRQRETHHNREIFSALVNKVALSRIVKMRGISWETLYHRIDFIHERCMAFVAHRERKLQSLPVKRLYLSIDAQDYIVNWTERKDKRNVVLKALTASDNETGYQPYNPAVLKKLLEIFRVHHNYTDLPMQGKKAEKKTPAMRLGLADAPLDFKDILYF